MAALCISQWYGRTNRLVEIASGTALWYRSGIRPVPIRWLMVRDPSGELEPQAFLATDLGAHPHDIITWFVRRWQVEVTFEEVRAHLGVETQRQWRIASPETLLKKFSADDGAAPPNRLGCAHGGNDQHGRAARGFVGVGGALPVCRAAGEGAHPRRAVPDDGSSPWCSLRPNYEAAVAPALAQIAAMGDALS